MDQLRLRLKVKVSSEPSYASAESSRLESHRKSNKLPLEQRVQRVLTPAHSDSHSHSGLMNEYAHSHRRRRSGRAGPSRAEPGPTQGRLRRLLCSPRSFGDSNLNLNFDFDFRFSIFVPQCRLSARQCRRGAGGGAGGRTGHHHHHEHGLITAQVQNSKAETELRPSRPTS